MSRLEDRTTFRFLSLCTIENRVELVALVDVVVVTAKRDEEIRIDGGHGKCSYSFGWWRSSSLSSWLKREKGRCSMNRSGNGKTNV